MFISFQKPHVIGQKVDMRLQNCNFISQWSAQQFNHAYFRKLYLHVMKTNYYAQYWITRA